MANKISSTEEHWRRFGQWIRTWRETHTELSQSGAAEKTGMTRQQWNRVEKGSSGTKRETVIRMAETIGADVMEALEQAGFTIPTDSPLREQGFRDSEVAALFYEYESMSEEDKKELGTVLEMVRQEIRRRKKAGEASTHRKSKKA